MSVEFARLFAQALHIDPTTIEATAGGARALVLLDGAL